MALTNEDLRAIAGLLQPLKDDIANVKADIAGVKADVAELKATVDSNHDMMLEFYGRQMEHNTEMGGKFDELSAQVEIFQNQTIKNTVELKRIK